MNYRLNVMTEKALDLGVLLDGLREYGAEVLAVDYNEPCENMASIDIVILKSSMRSTYAHGIACKRGWYAHIVA